MITVLFFVLISVTISFASYSDLRYSGELRHQSDGPRPDADRVQPG